MTNEDKGERLDLLDRIKLTFTVAFDNDNDKKTSNEPGIHVETEESQIPLLHTANPNSLENEDTGVGTQTDDSLDSQTSHTFNFSQDLDKLVQKFKTAIDEIKSKEASNGRNEDANTNGSQAPLLDNGSESTRSLAASHDVSTQTTASSIDSQETNEKKEDVIDKIKKKLDGVTIDKKA